MEPAALDLAFALALNQIKPSQKSVRDFILDLRKHIYAGKRPQFSATHEESRLNYLNAALYFESQQKRCEQQNEGLLNEIASLKRQLAALGEVPGKHSWNIRNSKKRKRATTEATNEVQEDGLTKYIEHLTDTYDMSCKKDRYMDLLRRLYDLQTEFSTLPIRRSKLYEQVRSVCNSFCLVLSDIGTNSTVDGDKDAFVFQGLPRVLAIIFRAVKEISLRKSTAETSSHTCEQEDQSIEHKVTYSVLSVFRANLGAIHSVSVLSTETSSKHQSTRTDRTKRVEESHLRAAIDTQDRADLLASLCRYYILFMLKGLSDSKASNENRHQGVCSDLVEGSLHLLLSCAGKLLYTLTFGTPRHDTLDAEILSCSTEPESTSSPIKRGRSTRKSKPAARQPDSAPGENAVHSGQEATEAEARSIMPLLKLLLPHCVSSTESVHLRQGHSSGSSGKKDHHQDSCNQNEKGAHPSDRIRTTQKPTDSRVRSNAEKTVIDKPLHMLQNTLVSAIFGHASDPESHLDPDIFGETLNCPANLLDGLEAPCSDDDSAGLGDEGDDSGEAGKWFVRRMWELVGWNVLAQGLQISGETREDGTSSAMATVGDEVLGECEEHLM